MTTQVERLTRIETLIEQMTKTIDKGNTDQRRSDDALRAELKALREEMVADKADLAALKNRGIGLLIGVGALGGSVGAALSKSWQALFGH